MKRNRDKIVYRDTACKNIVILYFILFYRPPLLGRHIYSIYTHTATVHKEKTGRNKTTVKTEALKY
jgi:hypothetical protein